MIERYTIKFGPAVSQKELEKALHDEADISAHTSLNKMKARIEIIADFDDLKKIRKYVESLKKDGT